MFSLCWSPWCFKKQQTVQASNNPMVGTCRCIAIAQGAHKRDSYHRNIVYCSHLLGVWVVLDVEGLATKGSGQLIAAGANSAIGIHALHGCQGKGGGAGAGAYIAGSLDVTAALVHRGEGEGAVTVQHQLRRGDAGLRASGYSFMKHDMHTNKKTDGLCAAATPKSGVPCFTELD